MKIYKSNAYQYVNTIKLQGRKVTVIINPCKTGISAYKYRKTQIYKKGGLRKKPALLLTTDESNHARNTVAEKN